MFAIISYSSGGGVADGDPDGGGDYIVPVALCWSSANLGSGLLAMLNNSAANAAPRRVALGSLLPEIIGSPSSCRLSIRWRI